MKRQSKSLCLRGILPTVIGIGSTLIVFSQVNTPEINVTAMTSNNAVGVIDKQVELPVLKKDSHIIREEPTLNMWLSSLCGNTNKGMTALNQIITNETKLEVKSIKSISVTLKSDHAFLIAITLRNGYVFANTNQATGQSPENTPIIYKAKLPEPLLSNELSASGVEQTVDEGGNNLDESTKIQWINKGISTPSQLQRDHISSIVLQVLSKDKPTKFTFKIDLAPGYVFANNESTWQSSVNTPITYY